MFKIFEYLRPYYSKALLNVIFNILTAFFSIISMVLLKPFLDILFAAEIPPLPTYEGSSFISFPIVWFNRTLIEYIVQHGHSAALFLVCIFIVASFFFKNLFRYRSTIGLELGCSEAVLIASFFCDPLNNLDDNASRKACAGVTEVAALVPAVAA
jgi:ABC-type multidrug transport system fused ATPase/permease subunit